MFFVITLFYQFCQNLALMTKHALTSMMEESDRDYIVPFIYYKQYMIQFKQVFVLHQITKFIKEIYTKSI